MGVGNSQEMYDDPEFQDKLCKLSPSVMHVTLHGMMKMHIQESETLMRILFDFRAHIKECKKIFDMQNANVHRPKRLQLARQSSSRKKSSRPKSRKLNRFHRTKSQSSIDLANRNRMQKYGLHDPRRDSGLESGSSSDKNLNRRYGLESGFESGFDSDRFGTMYSEIDETRDILVELKEEDEKMAKVHARQMVDDLAKKETAYGDEKMRQHEIIQQKRRDKKNKAVNMATNMVKDVDKVNESYALEKDRQKEKMKEMLEEKQRRKREKENVNYS